MPRCARALVVIALVGVSVLASQGSIGHKADSGGGPLVHAVVLSPTPVTGQISTPPQTGQH